jgi:predicted anti-sigma-YlaC factor YlaD
METLEQYSLQRLPKTRVGGIEKHLLICSSCRDRLDAAELLLRAMQGGAPALLDRLQERNAGQRRFSGRSEAAAPRQLTLWGDSGSFH